MHKSQKSMAIIAMCTIFFFSSWSVDNAHAWVTQSSQLAHLTRNWIATNGVTYAPSVPVGASFIPLLRTGSVILGVAAAGYMLYSYCKDDTKSVSGTGDISFPGGISIVSQDSLGALQQTYCEGVGKISGQDLENTVLKDAASKSKYPHLADALSKTRLVPLNKTTPDGSIVASSGGTGAYLTSNSYTVGPAQLAHTPPRISQDGVPPNKIYTESWGVNPSAYFVTIQLTGCPMPSPQPIPLNQIASAISDGSDKPVWAVDLTDIDNVVKDNPNIVHFDDPPTNLKPVIQAVGDAAQSTQDAIAAAPPVTGAGTSAANTAASSAAAASTSAAATASAAAAAAASAAAAAAAANAAAANAPGDAGLAAAASAANDAANSAYAAANVANTDAAAAAANAQQKAAQAAAATAADGNGLLAKLLGLGSSIWSTLKEMLTYTKDTRTADDAAITATGMPEQPAFGTYSGGKLDTSKLPIKKDIKSGLADFLSKSPSLNLIKSLVISTTESNSDMSFQFQGKTVTADFSHWNGILGGVGTSMLLIVHGLGLLIVFKRE